MNIQFTKGFKNDMDRLFSWRWAPYRWMRNFFRLPKEIKWTWQRATRGWANSDTWSFDGYIAKVIADALAYFAENLHSAPPEMFDPACYEDGDCSRVKDRALHDQGFENWKVCVQKMVAGFRAVEQMDELDLNDFDNDYKKYTARADELEAIRIEGMTLFVKHFHALWD